MRTAFGTSLLFVLAGALAATAAPAPQAILTGSDALVPTGVPTTIRFKVERSNAARYDLRNVRVEFWANGALLGSALSGKDGYAELPLSTPSSPGDLIVTGKLASGSPCAAAPGTLLVSVRDASKRIVVIDVDGTLSAASWSTVVKTSNSSLHPVKGAVRAVNDLARDATVLYLTAREDNYRDKTKDWLTRWGFPRAPVLCSDGDHSSPDPRVYKTGVLRELAAFFPKVEAGFGNRESDARAYRDNGVASFLFDTQGGPYPSYALVTKDWDDLRARNAAGKVPGLSWATSFK